MHVRQLIREAARVALLDLTTTGPRVYASRVHVMGDAHLPGLRIATLSESAQLQAAHLPAQGQQGVYRRDVELIVDACVKRGDQSAEVLDTICEEVETALAAGFTVDGQVILPQYEGTEIEMDGGVDQRIEVASMKFTCVIFTRADQPGRNLNSL